MRTASVLLTVVALLASKGGAADRDRPTIPNVALRTQDNQPVRFYDDLIKGKTVVISFMFADCKAVWGGRGARTRASTVSSSISNEATGSVTI